MIPEKKPINGPKINPTVLIVTHSNVSRTDGKTRIGVYVVKKTVNATDIPVKSAPYVTCLTVKRRLPGTKIILLLV